MDRKNGAELIVDAAIHGERGSILFLLHHLEIFEGLDAKSVVVMKLFDKVNNTRKEKNEYKIVRKLNS